jgi:DNA repair protein RadD
MQFRYYQREAIDALWGYFRERTGNPLVLLPTGTGKSLVIGGFTTEAVYYYPRTRIVMLTHVKELIAQNLNKLLLLWPQAPVGVFSAGLRRKEPAAQILYAGVQSVANAPAEIGWVDIVIIDECHLVSPDDETRYGMILDVWRKLNPALKVIGLTATGWRRKHGLLTNEGGLFNDVAYDRTKPSDFQRFITEGFLAPVVARATKTQLDLSEVGISNGDYNATQLEAAVDKPTVTQDALREVIANGDGRRAWLLFCSGITHAEHVAGVLNGWGIRTGVVHSKMGARERDAVLNDWYSGRLRAVTNNNVLTTGIDYPAVDLIAMLRPTLSSSLWVQMLGRGMRPAQAKANCLVLDFAANTEKNGPVDDPIIPGKPRPGPPGDAPVKICEACGTYNYASARFCTHCGADFPTHEKLNRESSDAPLMSAPLPMIELFKVSSVLYHGYVSKANQRYMRVTYHCGIRAFHEPVMIESDGRSKHLARTWWMKRHHTEMPSTVDEALEIAPHLRTPHAIRVWVNGKYPEIVEHIWENYDGV